MGALAQIVGKIRLSQAPLVNHWWQVTFYVSPRGLTTSAIPHAAGSFDIEFDFIDHTLHIRSSDGRTRQVALEPKLVAAFYAETIGAMGELGVPVQIQARPNEVDPAIPFAEDHEHRSYDAAAATVFWQQLAAADRVMHEFRSRFIGKVSPVHFFWGSDGSGVHQILGADSAAAPGWRPQLWRLGHGGGLLP